MIDQSIDLIKQRLNTHSICSAEDKAAVSTLNYFLRSEGRIMANFEDCDKWPNIDGFFEFVEDPSVSRKPTQNFCVQIKGTHNYTESDGVIKYNLQSVAFPAYIATETTADPGILFVVLNPDVRGSERVFWKYMSVDFINSIDFNNKSKTIYFSQDEEIKCTEESILNFCKRLKDIVLLHSFVSKLSDTRLSYDEIERIIKVCDIQITRNLDEIDVASRDMVSQMILPRLYDLCMATLLLNSLKLGNTKPNLKLAWEQSLLNINTKYLAVFMKGLKYIDGRIPDDGQSERLMLKYYDFMWNIRNFVKDQYGLSILQNLEKFPLDNDKLDEHYYKLIAESFESADLSVNDFSPSRFYIVKKTPFFIGKEKFYEITFQLSGLYATKYNRLTAYTKENISTNYSLKIGWTETFIDLWGIKSCIKIITNWEVAIEPKCLNKLSKIIKIPTKISVKFGEYSALMDFLTKTGINLLELIDLDNALFNKTIEEIYRASRTTQFKDVLVYLHSVYSKNSDLIGAKTVRYLLLNLREETIINVMPRSDQSILPASELFLSKRCYPFERNPLLSNLPNCNTGTSNNIKNIADVIDKEDLKRVYPYLKIKNRIKETGEIFFDINSIATEEEILNYNESLDKWELSNGYRINVENGLVSIDSYEKTTICILKRLLEFSKKCNDGQEEYNKNFLKNSSINFNDPLKKQALQNAFVKSNILLIYGAAGTGKTTLINYLSNMMSGHKKLFLTKTHTAKQNLERRIETPGPHADFISIDSFTKRVNLPDYDVIFVDECSTIDNRTIWNFLNKVNDDTFIVFAGDIHQIESIDFGNWFYYAKDIINTPGSNIELLNTWRTKDEHIINLWQEVRHNGDIVTELLAMDGPFSDEIGEKIFEDKDDDEVVLCLNYDGKFGLNNMNSYFQSNNPNTDLVVWQEWCYKVGDSILFNDTKRFSLLYNNLKGKIVGIEKSIDKITFIIDILIVLTKKDCDKEGIDFIYAKDGSTRISFSVYAYDENTEDEEKIMKTVVPFQLAYAVSIHKAQGLEYDTVKVVIPKSNSEKITHGIFYTAITRAKKKLKIYWDAEIMNKIIKSFDSNKTEQISLQIIKDKILKNES